MNKRLALASLALTLGLIPALAFAGSQSYSSPGSYTFNVPANSTVTVQLWGAGGGGSGGCCGGWGEGGGGGDGGGGGGYTTATFSSNQLPSSLTVTVGGGGGSGQPGGTSSFGSYLSASGGGGGASSVYSTASRAAGGSYSGGSGENGASGAVGPSTGDADQYASNGSSASCAGGGGGGGGSETEQTDPTSGDYQMIYDTPMAAGSSGCGGSGGAGGAIDSGTGGSGGAPGGGGGGGMSGTAADPSGSWQIITDNAGYAASTEPSSWYNQAYASSGGSGGNGQVNISWTINPTCPDGSAAPNGDPSQCTCAQGNTSACATCPDGSLAPNNSAAQCTCAQGNASACATCPDGSAAPNNSAAQCTCAHGNTAACTSSATCPDGSAAPNNNPAQCTCAQGNTAACATCPDGSAAPNNNAAQCTCAQGNTAACSSASPSCSISFNPNPMAGSSSQMSWNTQNVTGSEYLYIDNYGPASASGQTTVYTAADYTGTIYASDGVTALASCPATLQSGSGMCPDGSAAPGGDQSQCTCAQGNQNACGSPPGQNTSCPNGQFSQAGSCVSSCSSGYLQQGNSCVGSCSPGYTQVGTRCTFTACPVGYVQSTDRSGNPVCIFSHCPQGYTRQGTQCINNQNQCTPGNVCGADGNVYFQSASCNQSLVQVCQWGCAAGACLPPPAPEIATWHVSPTLVRSGETAAIVWEAQNVASCSVTGTNGDNWTGISGTETSSKINMQTTYTILCIGYQGADPASASARTVINIVPNFCESGAPGC